jgi:IS30 family transposase
VISEAKQRQIFALAAKGTLNNPQIAKRVGCCKETVRLALRRGTIQTTAREARKKWRPAMPHRTVDEYRCGGCRYLITLEPCLICEARASPPP